MGLTVIYARTDRDRLFVSREDYKKEADKTRGPVEVVVDDRLVPGEVVLVQKATLSRTIMRWWRNFRRRWDMRREFNAREYRLLTLFEKCPKLGDLYHAYKYPALHRVMEAYARGDWDADKALAELAVFLLERNEELVNKLTKAATLASNTIVVSRETFNAMAKGIEESKED